MSDVQQGPGWWQASDGRWYPPDTRPAAGDQVTPLPPTRKRRLYVVAGVAVVLIVAAGLVLASQGGSESNKATPEAAMEENLRLMTEGRFAEAYRNLYPQQQALVTKDTFSRCFREAGTEGAQIDDFKVVHVEDEEVLIPGTDDRVNSKAITFKLTVDDDSATLTRHTVFIDGQWRIGLDDEQVDAMRDGNCP